MKKEKPLKRHQALVPYSWDHHAGLMFILNIRKGLKNNIASDRITQYALFFFNEDLKQHFRDEELNLFPLLPTNNLLRIQAEHEHHHIYHLIEKMDSDKSNSALLTEFSDTLDNHIRFEERILFPHIQNHISLPEVLHSGTTGNTPQCDKSDQWNDPFWRIDQK
jgi:iron-sulfur cluster repair protein YtfE (RIC family)